MPTKRVKRKPKPDGSICPPNKVTKVFIISESAQKVLEAAERWKKAFDDGVSYQEALSLCKAIDNWKRSQS